LFKLAADRAKSLPNESFWISLLGTSYFYLSILLYGVLTLVWLWVLSRIPLSRAYPFVVLAFVFTPALAVLFFKESVDPWYFAGLGLVLAGLGLLVWKAS
jgi:drug/metabolite transporter (DMT)-like permease